MIYNVTHKKGNEINFGKDYRPLYVGDVFEDHNTDHINHLNPYINEMTGLYWLWKNVDDEYIGLAHYRRVFQAEPLDRDHIMTLDNAIEKLKNADIIVSNLYKMNISIYHHLRNDLFSDTIIFNKYYHKVCDRFGENIEFYFKDNKYFNICNMFITRKEIMDRYCEWIFPVMIPITEEFIEKDAEKCNNKRLLGFICERLLTYWIVENGITRYQIPIKMYQ